VVEVRRSVPERSYAYAVFMLLLPSGTGAIMFLSLSVRPSMWLPKVHQRHIS